MTTVTRIAALKDFFGTEAKPVTNPELMAFFRAVGKEEFQKLAEECAKALGYKLEEAK